VKATAIILPTHVVSILNYPAKTPAFHSANNKWSLAPKHYLELIQQRPMSFPSAPVIRQWREYLPQSLHQLLAEIHSEAEILPLHDPSTRAPDFDALSKSKAGSPNIHDDRACASKAPTHGAVHIAFQSPFSTPPAAERRRPSTQLSAAWLSPRCNHRIFRDPVLPRWQQWRDSSGNHRDPFRPAW
jgi:hypothetical protein